MAGRPAEMTASRACPRSYHRTVLYSMLKALCSTAAPVLRLCLPWLLLFVTLEAPAQDFLPARSAYKYTTSIEAGRLVVRYEIADGYYLYRDRLGFETTTPGVTLGAATLPVGIDHEDEYFGKQVIYRDV